MGKRSKTRSRYQRRSRYQQRSRYQRGGSSNLEANSANSANSPSAWSYGLTTAGNGWTQYMNTLSTNNPSPSNVLVLNSKANGTMSGGKRRKGRKGRRTRSKRGGNIGSVVSQAAAPLTLIALNQFAKRYQKKR